MSKNRHFKALDTFESERRIFKKGEIYTAYFRGNMYTLVAENGEFNFTPELMDRVDNEWKDMFEEWTLTEQGAETVKTFILKERAE
ncbi:hypothetical protein FOT81_27255 [Raoultella planticola]|nr:hypothetical protein [Raoultella planticola]